MSHEFDGLDATEKAGVEGALNRCRALAAQIASGLRKKRPEHFVDKFSLADLCVSLEQAADVLGQKGQRSVPALEHPISASRGLRDTAPYQPQALFVEHKPLSSDRI